MGDKSPKEKMKKRKQQIQSKKGERNKQSEIPDDNHNLVE